MILPRKPTRVPSPGAFSRPSTAYDYRNVLVPSGRPRFARLDGMPGVLAEEGSANKITDQANYSLWPSAAATVTLETSGPYAGWYKCVATAAGSSGNIIYLQTFPVPNLETDTCSIEFVGSGNVSMVMQGGALAGALVNIGGNRWAYTWNNNTGASKTEYVVFKVAAAGPTNETFYYRRYQAEAKPYALSFIDGARSPETILIPNSGLLGGAAGTIEGFIRLNRSPGTNAQYIFDGGGALNANLALYVGTGGKLTAEYGTGAATRTITGTTNLAKDTTYKASLSWGAGGVTVKLNDVQEGTDATAPGIVLGANSYLGSKADGTLQLDGYLMDMALSGRSWRPGRSRKVIL